MMNIMEYTGENGAGDRASHCCTDRSVVLRKGSKRLSFLQRIIENMLCWRDLSKKCVEEDCPMWMNKFELVDVVDAESLGLNENKCAHVFNEKLGVMKKMVEIIESMDFLPFSVPENLEEGREKRKHKAAVPKGPAARPGKPARKPRETPVVKEKQMPLQK
jgi:hypothetical protein